jgi:hypothetical protein
VAIEALGRPAPAAAGAAAVSIDRAPSDRRCRIQAPQAAVMQSFACKGLSALCQQMNRRYGKHTYMATA